MAKLELTLAHSLNERSRPILEKKIAPAGIDFRPSVMSPPDIFYRQLHGQEFDVSEMSMSSLLIALDRGDRNWVGLPIFTTRHFFQTWAWVRADAGIDKPEDLKGKRVGVPEYQQTAALWTRGILQHEFGVAPTDMDWYMERTEEMSHGGATGGFKPPAGLKFQYIPADKSIGSMMMNDELDATMLYITGSNMVDRSRIEFQGNPKVRKLFPDGEAESRRYFRKTGIFPINHGMVVRRSVYEQHPWVALNIFNAYRQAKEQWLSELQAQASTHVDLGLVPDGTSAGLRQDPYPYGVRSNRELLETLADYSYEQGLTSRRLQLDEIFVPNTMDL